MHFYVFEVMNGNVCYERTCSNAEAAEDRCRIIRARGREAFFMVDSLPEKWFY